MIRCLRFLGGIACIAFFSIGYAPKSSSTMLVEPISMYAHDTILYVSDRSAGIHVFHIDNAGQMEYKSTIPLQGNSGVAVKDSIIYANSWETILALRMKADMTVETTSVVAADLWELRPMDGDAIRGGWGCSRIVSHEVNPYSGGTGSSFAVFAIIDTFLYYINNSSLYSLSIANPAVPRMLDTNSFAWDLETLYPTDKYLFIGSATGMHIFNREPDPARPTHITSFAHSRACDPVVVRDTIAFVTLRSDNACGQGEDALLAINIAQPASPQLCGKTSPTTPYGLAVNDTAIFVGNGENGYSLYSAARPDSMYLVAQWPSPSVRDFLWFDDRLYILGTSEVLSYDVSDRMHPVRIGDGF